MQPGDVLALLIERYVATQVRPELVEPVTRAAAVAVTRLMSDPAFTEQLTVVIRLREENQWLRNNLAIAQEALRGQPPRKMATKRAAPRKSPAKKRTPTKAQKAAFQAGINDLRSPRRGDGDSPLVHPGLEAVDPVGQRLGGVVGGVDVLLHSLRLLRCGEHT